MGGGGGGETKQKCEIKSDASLQLNRVSFRGCKLCKCIWQIVSEEEEEEEEVHPPPSRRGERKVEELMTFDGQSTPPDYQLQITARRRRRRRS